MTLPSKSSLTVPQYHLLNRLAQKPRFVRGAKLAMARRLAERGFVQLDALHGIGVQATITYEGRRAHEEASG